MRHKITKILSLITAFYCATASFAIATNSNKYDAEEDQIQQAIRLSLQAQSPYADDDLALALQLVEQENAFIEAQRRQEQEQESLTLALLAQEEEDSKALQAENAQKHDDAALAAIMAAEEQKQYEDLVQLDRELALHLQDQDRRYRDPAQNNNNNNNNAPVVEQGPVAVPQLKVFDHVPAIGRVSCAVTNEYDHKKYYHTGTATLIEKGDFNILVSAAHIFHEVLTTKARMQEMKRTAGPVFIPLHNKNVSWRFEPNSPHARGVDIPVVAMVADAVYINGRQEDSSADFPQEMVKHDIVFLLLNKRFMPKYLPTICLLNEKLGRFSQMCALFGYGKLANADRAKRHHIVLPIVTPQVLAPFDKVSLVIDKLPTDFTAAQKEIQYLLARPNLTIKDGIASGSPKGDSGGPCIVVTPAGIRVIGVLSVYGNNETWQVDHRGQRIPGTERNHDYNGVASLVSGNAQSGFTLSPTAREMIALLKERGAKL